LENKSVKKQAAVLVAGMVAFAFVLLIPTPEGMSIAGQRLLAIVTLMAIWWIGEGAPITVTALLPLALFPLLGIMSSSEVAPNYGNHLVFLFLGGFMIALAMEKWSLHKRIALHIITRIGSDLPRIVLGFMVASAFL
jgi:sodium-dependent dicarboxylate transporter 2/3/5